jgi:hypothetical protein
MSRAYQNVSGAWHCAADQIVRRPGNKYVAAFISELRSVGRIDHHVRAGGIQANVISLNFVSAGLGQHPAIEAIDNVNALAAIA